MLLGEVGNTVWAISAAVIYGYIIICHLRGAEFSEGFFIGAFAMGAVISFFIGFIAVVISGNLPSHGGGSACKNYEYRGRGLECAD